MKLYFTFSSMPELQRLPAPERSSAYTELIHPLLTGWRVRLAKYVFTFALFSAALFAGVMDSTVRFIIFFAAYFVADYLFDLVVIRILRHRLTAAVSARLSRSPDETSSTP